GAAGYDVSVSGSRFAPGNITPNVMIDSTGSIDRMIVRTGDMTLKVGDVVATMDRITQLARSLGGYVVSSNLSGEEKNRSGYISIRVPSEKYDPATVSLRELAIEVLYESTQAQDVTEEYTDLDAQRTNLEATEKRYLELLQKAEKVEDMLKVEEMISRTRGEIERIKGRMKYLEETSATSLISVTLVEQGELETDFVADRIEAEKGQAIGFTNKTSGGAEPYGYRWDFGDGTTSAERDPGVHEYDNPGKYTITLTVTDAEGNSDTETKTGYITVMGESGWSAGDVAESAWHGLVNIGHVLAHLAIWLGVLSVIWVPILAIVLWNRHRRKKAG
ncbi:MAG: DUF4349 domain-containing protein, partial [Chloroflexi bacterium]|nr:DUF4349 domain-containing protein [Chloroflexota bacterium]